MSLAPGATLGFLGGGQLGRMTALAARAMGYRVAVLDPDPHCPLAPVADLVFTGAMDDLELVRRFAAACEVITFEREDVPAATAHAIRPLTPLFPRHGILTLVQDRLVQKTWLKDHGFPVAAFVGLESTWELEAAEGRMGFLKTRRGGFDGRGQVRVTPEVPLAQAWDLLGNLPCVLETPVPFTRELSILVARGQDGVAVAYPPAENHHTAGILDWSVLPAPLPAGLIRDASALALRLAGALDLVGVLVVELFALADGSLVVNELAPRPHNSYHASERACATSQFEQLVRVLAGLPLGSPEAVHPVAIANLLGDLWQETAPNFPAALQETGVRLHLYGKAQAAPGRKMGHLSASGATANDAVARVVRARRGLDRRNGDTPW